MNASKKLRELNRAKIEHDKAQLSAQIENGKGVLNNIAESVLAQTIERQAAQIEMMRFALTGAIAMVGHQDNIDYLKSVLATTPDQALEQFAAKVREQCAKACDAQADHPECPERAVYCAEAIRAIKELP